MASTETQFVTDDEGRHVAALIDIDRYRQLLNTLEEIEAIRAYDDAKASDDGTLTFEDAVREIERERGSQ